MIGYFRLAVANNPNSPLENLKPEYNTIWFIREHKQHIKETQGAQLEEWLTTNQKISGFICCF